MQVWGKNVKKWKTWGSKKNVVNKELLKLTRILLLLKQNLKTCHHMNLQKMTKSVTFLANDWFYLVVWVMMWVYRHMVAGDLNHFQYMELILWLTVLRHHSKLWFLFFCYHQMYWCTYQKKKKPLYWCKSLQWKIVCIGFLFTTVKSGIILMVICQIMAKGMSNKSVTKKWWIQFWDIYFLCCNFLSYINLQSST